MCEGFKLKAQFFVLSFVFLANCADEQRSSANCCLLQCARLSNCMKQKAPRYWVLDCIWNVMAHRRLHLKCDGTCAETRFGLSAKRTSPFKSAGASVQSTTGSRAVRISGSNAGYTMFPRSVKGTGYLLHSPVSPSLPVPCVTVYHHISTGL